MAIPTRGSWRLAWPVRVFLVAVLLGALAFLLSADSPSGVRSVSRA